MTETDIQNKIRKELSKYGVVLRLNTGVFRTADGRIISSGLPAGTSDLLYVGENKVAFLEVKTPSGRPSAEQINFINRMKKLGHTAAIVRSVDDALKMIGVHKNDN